MWQAPSSAFDYGYLVGMLEGEGSFTFHDGRVRVRVDQMEREPLDRLQKSSGGKVYGGEEGYRKIPSEEGRRWVWLVSHLDAVALMVSVYREMSAKRRTQISQVLAQCGRMRGESVAYYCREGHPTITKFDGTPLFKCKHCEQ